ncbi:peptidoglycan-binding domain-containing protein [Streptomyces sp. NPDC048659]
MGSGGVDGCFGAGTESAVKRFPRSYGLTADGTVAARTWGRLPTEKR